MRQALTVVILALTIFNCSGQEEINKKDFVFEIKDQQIKSQGDSIQISVRIKNNTDTAYLFFAFEWLSEAIADESFYTEDDNVTSANEVIILDSENQQVFPTNFTISPPDGEEFKPFSLDTLEASFSETGKKYVKKMLYLPANSKRDVSLTLSFKYHDLKPGSYDLYLLYYSGKNLYNLVPEEKVRQQEEEYDAKEFRGWIKSNKVELIIK
jgi:hypothetical protein